MKCSVALLSVLLLCPAVAASDFLMVRPMMDSPQNPVGSVAPAASGTGPVRQFFQNIFGTAPTAATPAPVAAAPYAAPAAPPNIVLPTTPAPAYAAPPVVTTPTYPAPVAVAPPVAPAPQPKRCLPQPRMCAPAASCSPTVNWPGCSPQTTYGTPTVIAPAAMVPQNVVIAAPAYGS
ncbi:MAG: hypothetical protein JSS27_21275 [Planctomycetes bacterium]|nr:hypothetical protein [Planctomycetota bacterium]